MREPESPLVALAKRWYSDVWEPGGGRAYRVGHVLRVRQRALALVQLEGLGDQVDLQVLEGAALFHDAAIALYKNQDDPQQRHTLEEDAATAVKVLSPYLSEAQLQRLQRVILEHHDPDTDLPEARILGDADMLDRFGLVALWRIFVQGGFRARDLDQTLTFWQEGEEKRLRWYGTLHYPTSRRWALAQWQRMARTALELWREARGDLPGEEVLAEFELWANRYDQDVAREEGPFRGYSQVLHRTAERALVGEGSQVLDVGTGTGGMAWLLARWGARVVGVDPSAAMLAVARRNRARRGIPERQVRFLHLDLPFLHLPFPPAWFDAVVSTYAFQYVPRVHWGIALWSLTRVLRPGGRLVLGDVAFPDREALERARRELPWLDRKLDYPVVAEIRAWLEDLGYRRIEAEPVHEWAWVLWAERPEL